MTQLPVWLTKPFPRQDLGQLLGQLLFSAQLHVCVLIKPFPRCRYFGPNKTVDSYSVDGHLREGGGLLGPPRATGSGGRRKAGKSIVGTIKLVVEQEAKRSCSYGPQRKVPKNAPHDDAPQGTERPAADAARQASTEQSSTGPASCGASCHLSAERQQPEKSARFLTCAGYRDR